ncbi:hypothetical protein PybrP1_005678 [[Pythium] brassicae (nom. inval.)]|nr:hypothetical protein PybrP1_005678 [[Pythium] brassicae (nom. inval.)]
MIHPESVAIMQEQPHGDRLFYDHKAPLDDATDVSDIRKRSSFSQRLWRLVRNTVLETPRRKVRSASYCPQSDERPRSSKRRARSCGHAADDPAQHHHHHVHQYYHHQDGSGCVATGTAVAWRKSKLLQELEASTASGRTNNGAAPATVALRHRCAQIDERVAQDAAFGASVSARGNRPAAQRKCRNCAQLFFARNVEPRVAGAFCSLDCKSSFEYLRGVQQLVDERIDEDAGESAAATVA